MFFKNFNGGCKSNCSCEEVKCFKKVCQWVPFTTNLGCSQLLVVVINVINAINVQNVMTAMIIIIIKFYIRIIKVLYRGLNVCNLALYFYVIGINNLHLQIPSDT